MHSYRAISTNEMNRRKLGNGIECEPVSNRWGDLDRPAAAAV